MNHPAIYLDHAATTPILPQVQAVVAAAWGRWANPSSQHTAGRAAHAMLEEARERVAAALGWPGPVIFTSGATEALALAWHGCAGTRKYAGATEHAAVLRHVMSAGDLLAVDRHGLIDPDHVPPAEVIAVQQVNSETGVIQPIPMIAARVHAGGGVLLTDCAQGAGKLALPEGADLVVIAGHKLGAPPGVGALLLRDSGVLAPSGGQERGYRPGTENLPYILGLATALEADAGWLDGARVLREWFEGEMRRSGAVVVAEAAPRVPTIGAYRLPGVLASLILIRADAAGVAISAGSACSSGSIRPSHVLMAMGMEDATAREVFRVSIGRDTTRADLAALLRIVGQAGGRMRGGVAP